MHADAPKGGPRSKPGRDDASSPILAALDEVRGAMERAVRALDRGDADGAGDAVAHAEQAAETMRRALAAIGGKPPAEALAAAKHVMALSTLALLQAGQARERVGMEMEALAARPRGVRAYRPPIDDDGGLDERS